MADDDQTSVFSPDVHVRTGNHGRDSDFNREHSDHGTESESVSHSESDRLLPRKIDTRPQSTTGSICSTDRHAIMESALTNNSHMCHAGKNQVSIDKYARRKLIMASSFCLCFMIAEVIGGILSDSLAIVSDAAHLLTDFATFMISLMAIYIASRKPTQKMSFGWHRAEVIGALISILFLWLITGVLVYMAIDRVINPDYEIEGTIMLITAGFGVAFNLLMGVTLNPGDDPSAKLVKGQSSTILSHSHGYGSISFHSHSRSTQSKKSEDVQAGGVGINDKESSGSSVDLEASQNINVRAAFVHVLGDLLQSVGVLVAAYIIYFRPDWKIADPICTFTFSVIVVFTTMTIMRDIVVVLMEGTPRHLSHLEVRDSLKEIEGVKDVHDLRIWALSMGKTALSVHLAVDKKVNPISALKMASDMVQTKFDIQETTIQVEEFARDMLDCYHCQDLPN